MGAPLKYDDEFLKEEASALVEWCRERDKKDKIPPLLERFAAERGYPAEYFSRWAKRNETFRQALLIFKNIQRANLIEGAVSFKYQPLMTNNTLKNVTDWTDKQEHKILGDKDNPLKWDIEIIEPKPAES